MGGTIFVTGGTGFVGRVVLAELQRRGLKVRALARGDGPPTGGVEWVRGSLPDDDPAPWLDGVHTVIHLAATTGKAPASEHRRVNLDGTARLVEASARAGVRRFVFMSTIAAAYPEHDHYPYGAAKLEAEAKVRDSGMQWLVLRPTIVLGPGSAILDALSGLAGLPVTPMFGAGRILIQPVDVADLAQTTVDAALEGPPNETLEIGGPHVLEFREFMLRLRQAKHGAPGRLVSLPLGLMYRTLAAFEAVLGPKLPLTAGQLYAFRYKSTAAPALFIDARRGGYRDIDAMLGVEPSGDDRGPTDRPQASAGGPDAEAKWAEEAERLTRYLVGAPPSAAVRAGYVRAHRRGDVFPPGGTTAIDRALTGIGTRGGLAARFADSLARFFAGGGLLRRKLVLLLALLETDADGRARVDTVETPQNLIWLVRMAAAGLLTVSLLALGLPLVIAAAVFGGGRR